MAFMGFFFASLPLSNCLISLLTSPFHPKEFDNGFIKEGKINPVPLARDNDAKNVIAEVALDGQFWSPIPHSKLMWFCLLDWDNRFFGKLSKPNS